jgi:hypothetical protein
MCSTSHTFDPCACVPADGGILVGGNSDGARVITDDIVLDNPDPIDGGTVAAHISHGRFWESPATFSSTFFWDAYLAPRTAGTLVSDGYGANHEFLWQAQPSADGSQLIFQGSVFDGSNEPFTAAEGPAPGEWGYHAVNLTSALGFGPPYVFTYWNGVAVGVSPFTTKQRRSVAPTGHGEGNLYVMGSTVGNTLGGRIAGLRAWDGTTPLGNDNPTWAFVPERTFSHEAGSATVDLLIDYTVAGVQVADLSPLGYSGGGAGPPRLHPGALLNFPEDQPSLKTGPGPSWVSDARSPFGKGGLLANTGERLPLRGSAPPRSLVFDSFARASQTFVFQLSPSLGFTEAGTLGARAWNTGSFNRPIVSSSFGILNGRAVFLERQPAIAWVDCGTADQDIRLARLTGPGQVGTTGIAFRVINTINWWYAIFVGEPPGFPSPSQLRVGYYLNTLHQPLVAYPAPVEGWKTLRVVASGSTLTFFVDNQTGGWTTVGSVTSDVLKTATGAGLAGARQSDEATSLWRGDDFTVCPAATGC